MFPRSLEPQAVAPVNNQCSVTTGTSSPRLRPNARSPAAR